MKTICHSASVDETLALAMRFAKNLRSGDVVAYRGDLGAGKTAFTRGLAAGLGCEGEVCSPTFALVHEYPGKITLYHFDMYRIMDTEDLYATGYDDYLESGVFWRSNGARISRMLCRSIPFLLPLRQTVRKAVPLNLIRKGS